MKVVILGKGLMLANIILGVKDSGADIVGVLRYEQTSVNPFKLFLEDTFNPSKELTLIRQLNLSEIKVKFANSEKFRRLMIALNVDLIIVGTWKERLKKETFSIPTVGTVNVHPSLLPKYRGPNPYMQTIMHGEKFSGVTLHLMDENYDTGAILLQKKVEILPEDTSKELRERTVLAARDSVAEFVTSLNGNIILPIAQSEKYATYFPNISGDERMLDCCAQTSDEVYRTVKALHPFLPCYVSFNGKFFVVNPYRVKILDEYVKAEPGTIIARDKKNRSITVVCNDGKLVKFEGLKLYRFGFLTGFYIK
ncbi:MAG: methionyl-tRNA formyltransferase [Muribaculaceae bacterium]|nr:methionyl-tRNA formyltransferase [Muribaculaceae bacterium]